jgi:hypothetical protein
MTVYFAGAEFGAFTSTDSATNESTDTSKFDEDFARVSMSCNGQATIGKSALFSGLSAGYCHQSFITTGGSHEDLTLVSATGVSLARIFHNGSTGTKLQFFTGGAWVDATAFTAADVTSSPVEFDLAWDFSASGFLRLYSNGSLLADSGTLDLSALADVAQVLIHGAVSALNSWHSEIIVADEPTIGWRLATISPTGAGSNSAWAGTFVDVDEAVHSDADAISSDTNGQVSTFTFDDPTVGDFLIKAVVVAARCKKGASGPANLQLAVRTNSTDFFSSSKAQDVGYGATINVWDTNPDTLTAWAAGELEEFGVKAVT